MRYRLGMSGLLLLGGFCACGQVAHEPASDGAAGADAGGALAVAAGTAGFAVAGNNEGSGIGGAGTAGVAGSAAGEPGVGGAGEAGGGAGEGGSAEPEEPHPYRALHLALGGLHSCALLEDHQVKCWGQNFYGQLGLGDIVDHGITGMGNALPVVDLGRGHSAKAIAAGRYATCAILDDDSAKCWGQAIMANFADTTQAHFALGDEPNEMGDALAPVRLGAGHYATHVAVGYSLACVGLEDDNFVCGDTDFKFGPAPRAPGVSLLSLVGSSSVAGLYSDHSLRWLNGDPTKPPALSQSDVVLVGAADSCVATWSVDHTLNLDRSTIHETYAVPQITSLAASQNGQACAITGDHQVHCWGAVPVQSRQLEPDHSLVIPLPGEPVELAGNSYEHLCALLADGTVWCWDWQSDSAPAALGGRWYAPKQADLGIWKPPN